MSDTSFPGSEPGAPGPFPGNPGGPPEPSLGGEPGAPGPFPGGYPPATPPPTAPVGAPGPSGPTTAPVPPVAPYSPPPTAPPPGPTPGNGGGGGRSRRTPLLVAGVVVVLALVAAVTFVLVNRSDQAEAGEIFLEAATAPGPDPFTTQIASEPVTSLTTTTRKATTTTTRATTTTAAGTTAVNTSVGSTPGLYGGTNDNGRCDARQLAAFLVANPDKGRAWVEALNSDPTLTWSQGNKVRQDQISAYIAELTPVTLVADTRVTNYGYVNGRPTPRQSVLQAGTAVLVDRYGTPRAKCGCGNPLTQPVPVKATPVYTGPPWPGWNPTTVVVVQNSVTIINNFTLVNIGGDGYIVRPAGTDGGDDAVIPDLPDEEGPPTTERPTTTSGRASTSTTAPDEPTTVSPPMTAPVDPTGDFCTDVRAFIAWADATDASLSDQQLAEAAISQFAALVDESPAEIRADMEYFQTLFEHLAGGGGLDFLSDPQFNAANDRVTAYLHTTCGIEE